MSICSILYRLHLTYDTNELEMGESGLGINSNNIFLFASEIFSLHSYMYIKVVESNSNMFRTNVRDSLFSLMEKSPTRQSVCPKSLQRPVRTVD